MNEFKKKLSSCRTKIYFIEEINDECKQWIEANMKDAKKMVVDHFGESNASDIDFNFYSSLNITTNEPCWDMDVFVYYEEGGEA